MPESAPPLSAPAIQRGGFIRNKAAVVGIGETTYSKASGRTELALACSAIKTALDDAGLTVGDVDGVVRFEMDAIDDVALTQHLGLKNLRWMSETGYGGTGANAAIAHAALAVASGMATTVVCYRALNERSGVRYGQAATWMSDVAGGFAAFQMPWGLLTPAQAFAMFARRHMIAYGTTSEQFGAVSVATRHHATLNPRAMMRKPITLEDHQASRMITDPLRLLDCCIESDGACAVVVTSAERARSLRQPPALIAGGAQASGPKAQGIVFRETLDVAESIHAAKDLYASAGLGPEDVDAVMIYDHFSPFVLFSLEAFGFCPIGEGGPFVADGHTRVGGALPVNTHGGSLSEAYIHGLNHVVEAVRQIRGVSTAQVPDAEVVLSCSSVAQLASAVMLTRA